jgi:hypothetical protein
LTESRRENSPHLVKSLVPNRDLGSVPFFLRALSCIFAAALQSPKTIANTRTRLHAAERAAGQRTAAAQLDFEHDRERKGTDRRAPSRGLEAAQQARSS